VGARGLTAPAASRPAGTPLGDREQLLGKRVSGARCQPSGASHELVTDLPAGAEDVVGPDRGRRESIEQGALVGGQVRVEPLLPVAFARAVLRQHQPDQDVAQGADTAVCHDQLPPAQGHGQVAELVQEERHVGRR
jgi:hypothetical protein